MITPRFLHASYFIWIILPVAVALFYLVFGLPSILFSYDFRAVSHDPHARRHYTRCTYLGPYGAFTTFPNDGKCGWLRFYKNGGET